MKTEILTLDVPNENQRTYTTEAVTEALKNIPGDVMGQINYPTENFEQVNISAISHKINNLRIEDGKLIGDVTILKTPNGKLLEKLVEFPGSGFRPRSIADVDENGVISNLQIISIDFVNNPA